MGSFWVDFATYTSVLVVLCLLPFSVFWWRMEADRARFVGLLDRPAVSLDEDLLAGALDEEAKGWVKWIDRTLLDPNRKVPWARDDALKKYDAYVVASFPYQAMQRFLIAAPLFGVMITVFKFTSFQGGDLASDAGGLIQAVAGPLFVGVGSGAAAALLGQLLWLVATWRWAAARSAAGEWFDRDVWPRQAQSTASADLASALVRFNRTLRRATRRYRRSTDDWLSATEGLGSGTKALLERGDTAAEQFEQLTRQIAETLRPLADATGSLTGFETQVADIGETLAALRKVIDDDLGPGAKVVGEAGKSLAAGAESLRQQTGELTTACGQFRKAADDVFLQGYGEAAKSLVARGDAAAGQFQTVADTLVRTVAPLADVAGSLTGLDAKVAGIGEALAGLRKVIDDDLGPGAKAVGEAGKSLAGGAEALREQSRVHGEAAGELATASGKFCRVADAILNSTGSLSVDAGALRTVVVAFGAAAEQLKDATATLEDFAGHAVTPLAESCEQLKALFDDCRQVAAELKGLPESHEQLVQILGGLKQAGEAAAEMSRLPEQVGKTMQEANTALTAAAAQAFESLKQSVAESGTAIRELPENLKASLEQTEKALRDFSDQMLGDQMNCLAITLEQILTKLGNLPKHPR